MKLNNIKWFTLVEMLVALTIFSFLVIVLFEVYIQTVKINKRLEYISIVQEDIRKVTRTLKNDFRNYKVDYSKYPSDLNYDSTWLDVLHLTDWDMPLSKTITYYLAKWTVWSYSPCMDSENNECFIVKVDINWVKTNITKYTRIKNLKFYISWKNDWSNSEVTKILSTYLIWIPERSKSWISEEIQADSFISVQSTISERLYLK